MFYCHLFIREMEDATSCRHYNYCWQEAKYLFYYIIFWFLIQLRKFNNTNNADIKFIFLISAMSAIYLLKLSNNLFLTQKVFFLMFRKINSIQIHWITMYTVHIPILANIWLINVCGDVTSPPMSRDIYSVHGNHIKKCLVITRN